jgi:hypothetical protein
MAIANDPFILARRLTVWFMPLAAVAALGGLFWPSVYRETAWVVPQNRGQDLVTLIVVMALAWAMRPATAGTARAMIIWSGFLAYLWYTFVGAAFSYRFNALFLVYVAGLSLSTAALAALFSKLDASWLRSSFSERAPRKSVSIFLVVMSAVLATLWLSQVFMFLATGELPDLIVKAETPTNFVFVLDLGFVIPLSLVAALNLWRDRPWGYALAGMMTMKAATMGLALVAMTFFAYRADIAVDWWLGSFWLLLTLSGSAMTVWFISSCRRGGRDEQGSQSQRF